MTAVMQHSEEKFRDVIALYLERISRRVDAKPIFSGRRSGGISKTMPSLPSPTNALDLFMAFCGI
ncbi:MAG: hypothetical protein ACR652_19900 [Methylocystis sp.]|uniref:hypothetical protein n=1 Tax=Methylocystis sp. TaxID=1911079 RepID=UPI003DA30FF4